MRLNPNQNVSIVKLEYQIFSCSFCHSYPLEPKLFDYGVTPRSSSPSVVTSVTSVTSPLKCSSSDSIQNSTVTIATASSPVLSPVKPASNGDSVSTEMNCLTPGEGRKKLAQECRQQSMAGRSPDSEPQTPSFDGKGFTEDSDNGERLLDMSSVKMELFTPSSDGHLHSQGDLDLESPVSRRKDERAGCHGNKADTSIHIDSVRHVVCNLLQMYLYLSNHSQMKIT